ncbi:efflux RND transporter periplasmic adaptor subunit [Wenzhouxiangella sediminis]|uniref:Efflux RND transporter periplasmic adaptor subunit n=1 Tax=Wenzhouxiangella sediminis TaxID=1792836 RepID=A0A3E1K668_9GAMM|nr:efflux RND transporter periplasmic adaptor subunit [Wenzhouxiangella sediminis]RFF29505.1 efflux RND transporter periplasmic adaptor subunit [Wenzhouxiangella sediminis]
MNITQTIKHIASSAVLAGALLAAPALAANQPVVSVVPVESDRVSPTLMVTGTVQSRFDSAVSAGIAGSITWVAEPGTRVAQGEAVARLDDRSFELAVRELEARLKKKEIEIGRLERDLERYRRLQAQQSISARDVDALEADLGMARSDAELLAVEIDRAREDLAKTQIVAPFDGMVTKRFQQQGESVSATQPVAQLVSTDALEIRFHGPLAHSELPSAVGTLRVHWGSGSAEMAVRATVPVSDEQSQSFVGYLTVPADMASRFRIGQLISVAVPTALPSEQFIVPRDALVLGEKQIRVFVLDEDGKALAIPVEVGADHGDFVAVEGSLAAGQQVIVRGAESIRSGDQVTVLSSEEFPVTTLNS